MIFGSLAVMAGLVALLWISSNSVGSKEQADELVLFCATGLLKPVREVCADYEKEYGVKVRIEPDSSGALLTKLRVASDRVDLYLSGEESFIRDAVKQGLVAETLPVARATRGAGRSAGQPAEDCSAEGLVAGRGSGWWCRTPS